MKKIILSAVIGVFFVGAALPVFAQTSSTTDLIKQLQAQISALQAQIDTLQKAQQGVQTARQDVQGTLKLLKQLRQGMSGDDVKLLQTVLAGDSDVYPEGLITGFFGQLTARAVKKFQEKHELEQAGNVGPKTLEKLNKFLQEHPLLKENDEDEHEDENDDTPGLQKGRLCAVVPPGHLVAPGWLRKHDGIRPLIPSCQKLPPGIEKKIPPPATTTPPVPPPAADTTAPIISGVSISALTSTSAAVNWTTNEAATSKVYYGTTTPLNLASAGTASSAVLSTSHSIPLSGLVASTTHYYVLESKDAANNTATSTEQNFVTLP